MRRLMRSHGPHDLLPASDLAGPLPKGCRPSGQDKESISCKPEISTGHLHLTPAGSPQPAPLPPGLPEGG